MSEIGKKYNDWTIIDDAPDRVDAAGKHHKRYLCQCKCGNKVVKGFYKIKNGAKMCRDCYLKILPQNGIPCEQHDNVKNRSVPKSNTSGFIGVSYNKNEHKWCSYLCCNNKVYHLGYYVDKADAVVARLKAEQEYFGEFAPQEHLFEEYGIE